MIFFTTFVTLIRRQLEGTERRLGSPARVADNTLLLPMGTDVQRGDYVEHHPPNDEPRMMAVIDVIHPHMPGATVVNDHIEVTCVPIERVSFQQFKYPALHPTMSSALALVDDGRMAEAVIEALRLVEERVRFLTGSEGSGHPLMESVFGARPPQLDITTTTGPAAEDEREGFRLLFIGAVLALRDPPLGDPHNTGIVDAATLNETFEYLAVTSMLMRRLDHAESRRGLRGGSSARD
ncbi:MAG: TIGR02391 family protein [Pseudonocardiaceae bacterium]